MSETPTYQLNQNIVYPCQGVGKIVDICEKKFKNEVLTYYVIDVLDMTIMVPVSKAESLGIRAIASEAEALEALEKISDETDSIPSDWKERYQRNQELLKKGNVADIAAIVRSSYHRSKVKELPILERKLYEQAKKLLEDEFSYALGKTPKEVEALLHSKLEPLGSSIEPRHAVSKYGDDDDDDDFDSDDEAVDISDNDDDDSDMDMDD